MSGATSIKQRPAAGRSAGPKAILAAACAGLIAAAAFALLPLAVSVAIIVVGCICFLAAARPAAAFVFVAAGLPCYHLAASEVLPGLKLTSLEFVSAFLLLGLMIPRPERLAPRLKELPAQFWLLLGMLIWAAASIAMSPLGQERIVNAIKPFSAVLIFWFLTFTFARKPAAAPRLLIALIGGIVFAQAIGLPEAVTRTPMRGGRTVYVAEQRGGQMVPLQEVRITGLMGEPNFYAYGSVVALPICLAGLLGRRRKWAWAAAAAPSAAALVLSYSRAAFLAVIAGAVWVVLRAPRGRLVALLMLVAALLIGAIVAPEAYIRRVTGVSTLRSDPSVQWRVDAWRAAVQAVHDYPMFGVGAGNITRITPRGLYAHNSYLEVAAELGIPGLLAFLAIFALSLRDAFRFSAQTKGSSRFMMIGLQAALVATAVFWFFASMFGHKMAWFLMATASASALRATRQAPDAAAPHDNSVLTKITKSN